MSDNKDDDLPTIVCKTGASYFTDSITGPCAKCGAQVTWRPHNPEPSIKMCIECVLAMLKDAGEDTMKFDVTQKSMEEVAQFLRAQEPTDDPWEA